LIKESKNSIELNIQNFKFVLTACYIMFFSEISMLACKVEFTTFDFFSTDIFILTILSILMCFTKSRSSLNAYKPIFNVL